VDNGDYRHSDHAVERITFALGTATTASVSVTASGAALPEQTCYSGISPGAALPFRAQWNPLTETTARLTLSVPSGSTDTYPARLEVVNGGLVNILVKRKVPGTSNDPVLPLVNEAPNPLPPPEEDWSLYKHAGTTALEILTADATASVTISPPSGAALDGQNVKARLSRTPGETTTWTWSAAPQGVRLDMSAESDNSTFDLTASEQPPQVLKVTVKFVVIAPPT
jgi:hypothetical protein